MPVVAWEWKSTGQTYREAWQAAGDDTMARRAVLADVLDGGVVKPGGRGLKGPESVRARLMFHWIPDSSWAA